MRRTIIDWQDQADKDKWPKSSIGRQILDDWEIANAEVINTVTKVFRDHSRLIDAISNLFRELNMMANEEFEEYNNEENT
jgi:hypothetical protein